MFYMVWCVWLLFANAAFALTADSKHSRVLLNPNLELVNLEPDVFVVRQIAQPYQANGLLVQIGAHFVIVDAKDRPEDGSALLDWIQKKSRQPKITVMNSHFHPDAVGSNKVFKNAGAQVIGSVLTSEILKISGHTELQPTQTFSLKNPPTLTIEGETIEIIFPGPSHSPDDVVIYFPKRKVLFGSCMSKIGDNLGNLADADLKSWRTAMDRIKQIPAAWVVPGHGDDYTPRVISNTIRLLDTALASPKTP